jgi:hypothetical protein
MVRILVSGIGAHQAENVSKTVCKHRQKEPRSVPNCQSRKHWDRWHAERWMPSRWVRDGSALEDADPAHQPPWQANGGSGSTEFQKISHKNSGISRFGAGAAGGWTVNPPTPGGG